MICKTPKSFAFVDLAAAAEVSAFILDAIPDHCPPGHEHLWAAVADALFAITNDTDAIVGEDMIDRRKEALVAFQAADNEWSAQIEAKFGSEAADARYTGKAKGMEGTPLRAAYEARCAARKAWDASREAARAGK